MRVCLFTDTLGDINGVSRFVRGMAGEAHRAGRKLLVACSTRFEVPGAPNLINFRPRGAVRMPRYEHLELAWPPARAMLDWVRRMRPDAIHVSTPGPVGLVGRRAARVLGVPLVGVYHTDFPMYVGHLFEDPVCQRAAAAYMGWFYRPFARVLTRSRGYAGAVEAVGIAPDRIEPLRAGIDVEAFHPRHRDEGVWARLGVGPGPKVLYAGRVSVEKGLPLLARAWRGLMGAGANGPSIHGGDGPPTLVVMGDGPYRARMERELEGMRAAFLGFRHGPELRAVYASSDLFAFPSTTDTLGQVVMEAMASGLPAIVTGTGGPAELVEDGATGRVLAGTDARAWAGAIARLSGDAALRRTWGAAAARAMSGQTVAASFEHFWDLHLQVVQGRARA